MIGVFDEYKGRGWIDSKGHSIAVTNFAAETIRLMRLMIIDIIPAYAFLIAESWTLIQKHHIYQADALQMSSSKHCEAQIFLTAEKRLTEIAISEGINARNVEHEQDEIKKDLMRLG